LVGRRIAAEEETPHARRSVLPQIESFAFGSKRSAGEMVQYLRTPYIHFAECDRKI